MNPAVLAYVGAVVWAGVITTVSTIGVPLLVAVIMGGPAWLTAHRNRQENRLFSEVICKRLGEIEQKLDSFSDWREAHMVDLANTLLVRDAMRETAEGD